MSKEVEVETVLEMAVVEETYHQPRALRGGRRQVINLRPPTLQEAPGSGDKRVEGEHNVLQPLTETTKMTQPNTQSHTFTFTPPMAQASLEEQFEAQKQMWMQSQADESSRQDAIARIQKAVMADGASYKVIMAADVHSSIKDKHLEKLGLAPRVPAGVRMQSAAVQTAIVVGSVCFALVMGAVTYFFLFGGKVVKTATPPMPLPDGAAV